MKTLFSEDRYWEGIVDAYLELLRKGIRDVCLPSFGTHTPSELEWIDDKAQKAGVVTLPIQKQAHSKAGAPIPEYFHCQRLLFVQGHEEKAHKLKQLLESYETNKERNTARNRRIGQLLGYRADKIEEFVSRHRDSARIAPPAVP